MAASAEVGTLVVGEALIDVVVSASETTEHVGGSPANVASGLATLDHPVALLTHVATDDRGRRITEQLSGAGVRLSPGSDTADHTPTATARLDATGAATYEFDLDWAIPPVDLTGVTHLHTGSIAGTLEPGASQVLELAQAAREHATISYDPNLRPSIMGNPHDVRSRVEELVGLADVVKVSDEDLDWLYAGTPISQVAHLWGQLGPSVIVVTRGPGGAWGPAGAGRRRGPRRRHRHRGGRGLVHERAALRPARRRSARWPSGSGAAAGDRCPRHTPRSAAGSGLCPLDDRAGRCRSTDPL